MKPLRSIAYARSGDKGNAANIAVFGRSADAYHWMRDMLTAEDVRRWFQALGPSEVTRYDIPGLEALNFVLQDVLGGGGSRSLRIDAQGKALGMALLEMTLPIPDDVLASVGRERDGPSDHAEAQPPSLFP